MSTEDDDNTINKAREILSQRLYHSPALTHSDDTASFLALKLGQREQEVFAVILLNNQHQVIQYLEVFTGTINETSIYPREVVKLALKHNAAATILAHNHPSGLAEPSAADKSITTRLQQALALVDVTVLDHVVVGGGNTVSFAQRGWL